VGREPALSGAGPVQVVQTPHSQIPPNLQGGMQGITQLMLSPQPFVALPEHRPPQSGGLESHPHTFATPPPLQVSFPVQGLPQSCW